jgi:hypothetical protein
MELMKRARNDQEDSDKFKKALEEARKRLK